MVSMFKMRWVLVCLVVTICCVCADGDYEKLVQAFADESSERQFLSTIKRWFSRSSEMEKIQQQAQAPTKTKIKYLPVYVPYPVQPPAKVPLESQYYGAYHDPLRKKEVVESMFQRVHMVPNSHVVDYYLPFSGQLPTYVKRKEYPHYYTPMMQSSPVSYEVQLPNSNSHYVYDDGGYEAETGVFEDDDNSEYDSEVVENAELKNMNKTTKTGSRLRKVRRKGYVPRPRVVVSGELEHVPSTVIIRNPGL